MEIREHGFRKGDFYLGQKVKIKGNLYKGEGVIVGFYKNLDTVCCFLEEDKGYTEGKLINSTYAKYILGKYKQSTNWLWFDSTDITPIEKSEKEDVLKVRVQEINEDYSAIDIVYQNEEVLKRGKFRDSALKVKSANYPQYHLGTLYIKGIIEDKDNKPFIISNKDVPHILEIVKAVNEKYRIKKRWRAEKGERYYLVHCDISVAISYEENDSGDDKLYDLGNYYKTKEEAEVMAEKIRQVYKG